MIQIGQPNAIPFRWAVDQPSQLLPKNPAEDVRIPMTLQIPPSQAPQQPQPQSPPIQDSAGPAFIHTPPYGYAATSPHYLHAPRPPVGDVLVEHDDPSLANHSIKAPVFDGRLYSVY
jgi:hypothetical protein